MLFQEPPDPFNGVVLAVIGRVVGQFHSESELVDKVDNTIHELSASAMVLRAVILIDNKRRDIRKAFTDTEPAIRYAIDDEITGHLGGREVEIEFAVLR